MSKATDFCALLRKDVGLVESPPNSNHQKFGVAFGMDRQPWCAIMLSVQADHFGMRKNVDYPWSASVFAMRSWAKAKGMWHTSGPKVGDWVVYTYSHVDCITAVNSNGTIRTIGGNTSPGGGGSQRDGGGVFEKTKTRALISGYIRPNYTKGKPPGLVADTAHTTTPEKGIFGMGLLTPTKRTKDIALPNGKAVTLPHDEKNSTSILSGLKKGDQIDIQAPIAFTGLKPGDEVHYHWYYVNYYSDGRKTTRTKDYFKYADLLGSAGTETSGVMVFRDKVGIDPLKGASLRLRVEVKVFKAGVKVIQFETKPAKG